MLRPISSRAPGGARPLLDDDAEDDIAGFSALGPERETEPETPTRRRADVTALIGGANRFQAVTGFAEKNFLDEEARDALLEDKRALDRAIEWGPLDDAFEPARRLDDAHRRALGPNAAPAEQPDPFETRHLPYLNDEQMMGDIRERDPATGARRDRVTQEARRPAVEDKLKATARMKRRAGARAEARPAAPTPAPSAAASRPAPTPAPPRPGPRAATAPAAPAARSRPARSSAAPARPTPEPSPQTSATGRRAGLSKAEARALLAEVILPLTRGLAAEAGGARAGEIGGALTAAALRRAAALAAQGSGPDAIAADLRAGLERARAAAADLAAGAADAPVVPVEAPRPPNPIDAPAPFAPQVFDRRLRRHRAPTWREVTAELTDQAHALVAAGAAGDLFDPARAHDLIETRAFEDAAFARYRQFAPMWRRIRFEHRNPDASGRHGTLVASWLAPEEAPRFRAWLREARPGVPEDEAVRSLSDQDFRRYAAHAALADAVDEASLAWFVAEKLALAKGAGALGVEVAHDLILATRSAGAVARGALFDVLPPEALANTFVYGSAVSEAQVTEQTVKQVLTRDRAAWRGFDALVRERSAELAAFSTLPFAEQTARLDALAGKAASALAGAAAHVRDGPARRAAAEQSLLAALRRRDIDRAAYYEGLRGIGRDAAQDALTVLEAAPALRAVRGVRILG
ncbi:MAG: hypothetical protein AAFR16_05765, partial [Pseudomonadota bacterium]